MLRETKNGYFSLRFAFTLPSVEFGSEFARFIAVDVGAHAKMRTIKPNYNDLGFADHMGPKLRNHVERQLAADLKHYKVDKENLKFDWSDSCVEGHQTDYLDGSVENFSGIAVFDDQDNFVAEGWMDFIHDKDFFLAYWHYLTTWDRQKKLKDKKDGGIPKHIWRQIPDDIKPKYKFKRIKK